MSIRIRLSLLISIFALTAAPQNSVAAEMDLLSLKNWELETMYQPLVREFGYALAFNPGNSGAPLKKGDSGGRGAGRPIGRGQPDQSGGIRIGFEEGFLFGSSDVKDAVSLGGGGNISSTPITKIKIQAGLTPSIDAGFNFSYIGKTVSGSGMEVRYDISGFIPVYLLDLALRGHYSSAIVTNELNVYTAGFDVIAGMDLPSVKPYFVLGMVASRGAPSKALYDLNPDVVDDKVLSDAAITVGAKFAPLKNLSVITELGSLGAAKTFSIGAGYDF